jgi:hypothetical protein
MILKLPAAHFNTDHRTLRCPIRGVRGRFAADFAGGRRFDRRLEFHEAVAIGRKK